METFMEHCCPAMALAPDADRWNGSPASDVYSMANYSEITFLVIEAAGGVGTATITVEECTSAAGAGATAIAFDYKTATSADSSATWSAWTAATDAGFKPAAGANKMTAVRVLASDLSEDSPYVRAKLTEDNSDPCDACIVAILSNCRYPGEVPPDPTS